MIKASKSVEIYVCWPSNLTLLSEVKVHAFKFKICSADFYFIYPLSRSLMSDSDSYKSFRKGRKRPSVRI